MSVGVPSDAVEVDLNPLGDALYVTGEVWGTDDASGTGQICSHSVLDELDTAGQSSVL
jgi:hypothetical protein